MEDLADKIDDLICTFEGGGDTTMDTVAMYMFGWMLFGLVVLGVGRFVYGKFIRTRLTSEKSEPTEQPSPTTVTPKTDIVEVAKPVKPVVAEIVKPVSSGPGKYVPPTPPIRKRLGSKTGRPTGLVKSKSSSVIHPPPTATGPESESVKWVNDFFSWLYSDIVVVNELLNTWIQSLNDFTKKSVAEVSFFISVIKQAY